MGSSGGDADELLVQVVGGAECEVVVVIELGDEVREEVDEVG